MKLPTINLNRLYGQLLRTVRVNKTTIYATMASIGVIGTGVSAAKAAFKTKEYVDEYWDDSTLKEKIKWVGPVWIMPVVVGGITIFCIWRGHKIHLEKEASLAAMSAYWKKKHDDLEKKVTEKLGEEASKEIKEEIFREKMDTNVEIPKEKLVKGQFWVYDELSDQLIKTDSQRLIWASYTINQRWAQGLDVEYNWYLTLIGGRESDLVKGVGWSWDNEDQVDCMYYNCGNYWIDIKPDYFTQEDKNKCVDGVRIATLLFNNEPECFSTWK